MAAACNYLFTLHHHPPPEVSDIIKPASPALGSTTMNDRIIWELKLENKTEKDKLNTGQRVHLELYFG